MRTSQLSGRGLSFDRNSSQSTGERTSAKSKAPARAKAYVSAMGPKICPSGPAMVNSGRNAHTMMAVENARLRCTSPEARRIR